jgi:hypothetical protein
MICVIASVLFLICEIVLVVWSLWTDDDEE